VEGGHRLVVDAAADGTRLDRFLAGRLPGLSRSRLHALIEEGRVRVDGTVRKPSARVRAGQVVTVELPPAPPAPALVPEPLPLDVLYEDGDLLVVNKPPGLAVHPGPGHPRGTLANALLARVPELAALDPERPGIVHRLDKDTSGLLVVAKTPEALRALQGQVRARTMRRTYLVLVHGQPPPAGTVDAPIARDPRHRRRMAVVPSGRAAVTRYRVRERFAGAALVEATLLTGRTHQLRVHFKHLGHPVVGDPVYGRRGPAWGMTRQALHAWRLRLRHPRTGTALVLEAPLPDDLARALETLRRAQAAAGTGGGARGARGGAAGA
jgi:23S rRNA pseudouridine1911/1915/1917 synthase